MDFPSERCHEEEQYEQRLAALLAEVHCWSTVLGLMATNLSCQPGDLG